MEPFEKEVNINYIITKLETVRSIPMIAEQTGLDLKAIFVIKKIMEVNKDIDKAMADNSFVFNFGVQFNRLNVENSSSAISNIIQRQQNTKKLDYINIHDQIQDWVFETKVRMAHLVAHRGGFEGLLKKRLAQRDETEVALAYNYALKNFRTEIKEYIQTHKDKLNKRRSVRILEAI